MVQSNMECSTEKTQECSLKIDTVWSEADESLLIKEEIVSDLEAESNPPENIATQFQHENETSEISGWQPPRKKVKTKTRNDESDLSQKSTCMHDTKNFKIVKSRLRCGDCKALVCPECCKVMIPNLQSHFLGSGVCFSGTYLCKLCSVIFHSLCALQAHIRIHTMETPHVCPDCGLIYSNIYFLILHLLNKCFHVYKIVRYKCKQCPGSYFTAETFIQHIQDRHIHCVFRCLYCSSLFNNYAEFNYHIESVHQKQKVQYLNYFGCSLCSNMVIPKFMYQRHLAQHRENSEYYEVHYQCLCGETFSLIGAFRSHFNFCNKKGVLPPHWSFLQKKIKNHDLAHYMGIPSKEVVVVPKTVSDENDKPITSGDDKPEEITETKNDEVTCNGSESVDSIKEIKIEFEKNPVQESETDGITGEKKTEESMLDGKISKNYDHIPCDHLGYLTKTQFNDPTKKTAENNTETSPKSYKVVTELDEKTGLMSSKNVPVEELETDVEEEDRDYSVEDVFDADLSFNMGTKQHSNEKFKFKTGNSLCCPFCIVSFPKHNLTFQQFRLHLESYHPDAALNITVSAEPDQTLSPTEKPDDVTINSEIRAEAETSDKNTTETSLSTSKETVETIELLENTHETEKPLEEENSTDNLNGGQSFEIVTEKTVGEEEAENDTNFVDKEKEELKKVDDFGDHSEGSAEEQEKTNPLEVLNGDKNFPKSLSDLDYEGETSKDSNWSGISCKDSKSNSPGEEKERSRRESEVWSEFYETLKLAEKLKKRKKCLMNSENKKESVVSDYSSKRVVKKPKRYRESSDSEDSNEFSESDEEFLLENDSQTEDKQEEDQTNKKQILMNKLETVDGKLVDYLFDLVTKKEKLIQLYAKHSSLRASRYGHDLRSYRKKVLNGIKRGRPLKMLRYHDILRKKELASRRSLKKKSEFSLESKMSERKRGRPRKYHDARKLKERRRSDREVDFIEKNFEREEMDISPSKRKRKLSSKLQYYRKMSDEKEDFSSGQVITNKPMDSSKKIACAVCKESFTEANEFREHIMSHRTEENTYQCMECGECFVVRPSLEKHLHAFHKIKNTEKYITDNCNVKKEVESEPLKENQCKVCKDQFERAIDLTKHFRIHGMAFLKEFKKDGKSNEK